MLTYERSQRELETGHLNVWLPLSDEQFFYICFLGENNTSARDDVAQIGREKSACERAAAYLELAPTSSPMSLSVLTCVIVCVCVCVCV